METRENGSELYDLRSVEIVERLRDGNALVSANIVSHLHDSILKAIEAEAKDVNNWTNRENKLSWSLKTHVEIFANLYKCENLVNHLLSGAETKDVQQTLGDLIYELQFLALDVSGLFYELDYPTWNLLDFLDPDHYFPLKDIPEPLKGRFRLFPNLTPEVRELERFCLTLTEKGVNEETAELAGRELLTWCQHARLYAGLMVDFYESDGPINTLYTFHLLNSAAMLLLGKCLAAKLLLRPIHNQLKF